MKKELIITIIIIIVIIVVGNVTLSYTESVIKQTSKKLENLKQDILSEDYTTDELNKEIDNIYNKWMEDDKKLSLYLEHDEIEKVNVYLKNVKGFIEGDDSKTGLAEIESCIAILGHIEEKQAVNLKNIF